MHLRRPWIALCLLAASTAGAAVVYKWTDADGVVHFSDTAVPGAEKIITSSGSSNGISSGQANASANASPPARSSAAPVHTQLSIESPAQEQVFFGDDVIPVRLRLEPGLQPNQTLTWYLNGKQLDDQGPAAISFALQSLPRGAYTVAATVTDQATGQSQSADSVTFYVRQPSLLAPQHKKP
jgi:hypothetical protein